LDFVPWQSVGCVSPFDFYIKFVVVTCVPIGLLFIIMTFWFFPMYFLDVRDFSDDDAKRERRAALRRKTWKLCLFTVFLMYPSVSSNVLRFFVCKNIDDSTYLIADFTIKCTDSKWFSYLTLVLIMVFIYPVGVPVFFFYMLSKNRKNLTEPTIKMQLGFLYEAFNLDAWFFEVLDMGHKLTMTSLLAFLPLDSQMPMGMFVVMTYTWIIILRQPYLRRDDDMLHLFAQVELYLIVLAGYILTSLGTVALDEKTDIILSTVMITMSIGLLVAFMLMAIMNVRKMIRNHRRKKMRKTRSKMSNMSNSMSDNDKKQIRLNVNTKQYGPRKPRSKAAIIDERVREMTTMKTQWL